MAVRAIIFSEWRTRTSSLFQTLRILNVYDLHDLAISTFMFDLFNKNLPHSLIDYCDIILHRYSTRQKEDRQLRLPKCRTTQGQFSLSFVGSEFWNRLPINIRQSRSRNIFRNSLTTHLLTNNGWRKPFNLLSFKYLYCCCFIFQIICIKCCDKLTFIDFIFLK